MNKNRHKTCHQTIEVKGIDIFLQICGESRDACNTAPSWISKLLTYVS